MGLFSRKKDFLTQPEQRNVFSAVEKRVHQHLTDGFSIRNAIVAALKEGGFGHMGLGSSTETTMTSLVGQACGLRKTSPDDVEAHCKKLAAPELKKAISQASGWS